MIDRLTALVLHANTVPAEQRTAFAARAALALPEGGVLVQTCHRVEAYVLSAMPGSLEEISPAGATQLCDSDAARHLVRLAVGLESAVVAEDQVLHQLRRSMSEARTRGPLAPALDRLFDIALRSGRRARTWFPPSSRGLAEVAVRRVLADGHSPDRPVLVVGAGEMGRRAAWAIRRRGASLLVTSRTPERATALAAELGAAALPFDPGAASLAPLGGVIVALGGPWELAEPSARALLDGDGWLVDLSAPSALPASTMAALGSRLTTIDDLAEPSTSAISPRLMARLEQLVDGSVAEWLTWSERAPQRSLAGALAERANEAQSAELAALWRRAPDLAPQQREEVERMARHLAERLLRDPLEQLADDGEGARTRAARELFRL